MITNKLTVAKHTSIFPFVLFYQGDFKESPTFNIINIVEKHFEPLIDKISLKSLISVSGNAVNVSHGLPIKRPRR